jgi:hypothetical protein
MTGNGESWEPLSARDLAEAFAFKYSVCEFCNLLRRGKIHFIWTGNVGIRYVQENSR